MSYDHTSDPLDEDKTNYITRQRNWSAYDTLADADAGIKFKQPAVLVYIISEDTWYYWKNDTEEFVPLGGGIGTGGGILRVQDIPELTALLEGDLFDGEIVLVEDTGKLYRYDEQATSGDYLPDDDTDGIGYWIQTTAIQAVDVIYNNTTSGLTAINVQDAIDELVSSMGSMVVSFPNDPTVTDDSFPNGQHWINTVTKEVFYLVDNTPGAAVWSSTTIADSTIVKKIAGETIPGGRAVISTGNKIFLFDQTNSLHYGRVIGVSKTSGILNDLIFVTTEGYLNGLGGLTADKVLYCNTTTGDLSDIAPTTGIVQIIGVATSATEMIVDIKIPVIKA